MEGGNESSGFWKPEAGAAGATTRVELWDDAGKSERRGAELRGDTPTGERR